MPQLVGDVMRQTRTSWGFHHTYPAKSQRAIIPKEGAVMWVDNLCITKDAAADSDRMDMVYQWLDFLNRPDIAAINTNWVWYASPNKAAEDGILEEILTYPAIYPDAETFANLQYLGTVGDATEIYSRMWTEIKTE